MPLAWPQIRPLPRIGSVSQKGDQRRASARRRAQGRQGVLPKARHLRAREFTPFFDETVWVLDADHRMDRTFPSCVSRLALRLFHRRGELPIACPGLRKPLLVGI